MGQTHSTYPTLLEIPEVTIEDAKSTSKVKRTKVPKMNWKADMTDEFINILSLDGGRLVLANIHQAKVYKIAIF